MAFMFYVNLFLQILWNHIMPVVGVISVVVTLLVMGGHNIPIPTVRDRLGRRLLGRGSRILGRTLMAIKDEDGLWTVKPATYDSENNGYWVPTEDGREFYDASGIGGDPGGWYGGTSLAVAYDGLGALAEVASAEVGRQARVKKQLTEEDLSRSEYAAHKAKQKGGEYAEKGRQKGGELAAEGRDRAEPYLEKGKDKGRAYLAKAAERLLGRNYDDDIMPDGGEHIIEEWDSVLPQRKVVDLRDTVYAAPFNVRPQQFHRVAENAKKGQQGFAKLGPLGQAGIIMGAFMMGAIVCYLGFSATGGGGGISIPMGGSAGVIMPPLEVLS
jgi:hypothetical protein